MSDVINKILHYNSERTEVEWENKVLPIHIQVLINLEYRLITGYPARRATKSIEEKWAKDLALRLNKCLEKPTTYDTYLLCHYIANLQYEDFRLNLLTGDYKERVAQIIKDYLLTADELTEYNDYSLRMEKQ